MLDFIETLFFIVFVLLVLATAVLGLLHKLNTTKTSYLLICALALLFSSMAFDSVTTSSQYQGEELPDLMCNTFSIIVPFDFILILVLAIWLLINVVIKRN